MAALYRGLALRLAATLAFAAAASTAVEAQALERLHVRSIVLSVEPVRAKVGDTLRFVLRVHLDERVRQLDNVTLPDLTGFDVLGDERRCVPARRGTDCSEVLSLSPNEPGTAMIGPVVLDAKDAVTGKPMRYSSNTVRVTVEGQAPSPLPSSAPVSNAGEAKSLLLVAIVGFGIAISALVALAWFARRKPNTPPAVPRPEPGPARVEPPPPPIAPPGADGDARWRALVADLREHPTRDRVLIVREVLRRSVGARAEDTLADLDARNAGSSRRSAMDALRSIERAAFIDDERVPAAVSDALPALELVEHP